MNRGLNEFFAMGFVRVILWGFLIKSWEVFGDQLIRNFQNLVTVMLHSEFGLAGGLVDPVGGVEILYVYNQVVDQKSKVFLVHVVKNLKQEKAEDLSHLGHPVVALLGAQDCIFGFKRDFEESETLGISVGGELRLEDA